MLGRREGRALAPGVRADQWERQGFCRGRGRGRVTSVGHNLSQEAPQAFTQAVIDVASY